MDNLGGGAIDVIAQLATPQRDAERLFVRAERREIDDAADVDEPATGVARLRVTDRRHPAWPEVFRTLAGFIGQLACSARCWIVSLLQLTAGQLPALAASVADEYHRGIVFGDDEDVIGCFRLMRRERDQLIVGTC